MQINKRTHANQISKFIARRNFNSIICVQFENCAYYQATTPLNKNQFKNKKKKALTIIMSHHILSCGLSACEFNHSQNAD